MHALAVGADGLLTLDWSRQSMAPGAAVAVVLVREPYTADDGLDMVTKMFAHLPRFDLCRPRN